MDWGGMPVAVYVVAHLTDQSTHFRVMRWLMIRLVDSYFAITELTSAAIDLRYSKLLEL
jgi:hypothetical protein